MQSLCDSVNDFTFQTYDIPIKHKHDNIIQNFMLHFLGSVVYNILINLINQVIFPCMKKNVHRKTNYHTAKILLILVLIKVEDQKQCSMKFISSSNNIFLLSAMYPCICKEK